MAANSIPHLSTALPACLLTHRCSTASEVMVLSSNALNDGSSTTKMLPLSVPRYRTSREEWARTAVICVALGGDLGAQKDAHQLGAGRLLQLPLRELRAQQGHPQLTGFTGRHFKPGMIFLKEL